MPSFAVDPQSLFQRIAAAFPDLRFVPHDCWIVGGGLRDVFLERQPKDVDLAAPSSRLAARAFASATGGRAVLLSSHPLETWRVVIHADEFDFTDIAGDSIDVDLGRRDFTIGAITLSVAPPHELRDPFGGVADLQNGLVRMVSPQNLREDSIRLLRAIRIANQLDLMVEQDTTDFIREHAETIWLSAAERITAELDSLLAQNALRGLTLLRDHDLASRVFPDFVAVEAVDAVGHLDNSDLITIYGCILLSGTSPAIKGYAARMRWSGNRTRSVADLVEMARKTSEGLIETPIAVYDFGTSTARRAVEVLTAYDRNDVAADLRRVVTERGAELESIRPLLDGTRIGQVAQLLPGPRIGDLHRSLVEAQIRGNVTSPEEAEAFILSMVEGGRGERGSKDFETSD